MTDARRISSPGEATRTAAGAALILILAALALAAPAYISQPYFLQVAILAATYAIPAIGLNLMLGYTGLLSIGHMSIAGIGGYCAAVLMVDWGGDFWTALLAGTCLAGLAGLFLGYVSVHLRSHFFIIVTLATSMVLYTIFNNWDAVTRGAEGLPGIPRPAPLDLLGWTFEFRSLRGFYGLTIVALAAISLAQLAIVNSDYGRALRAIRQDEQLCEARGVNVIAYKISIFVVASAIAGFGGALKVAFLRVAAPVTFDAQESINLTLIVIAGGAGYQSGPLLGSILFLGLPEYLRVARAYRLIVFGAILVVMTRVLPRGLAGLIEAIGARLFRRGIGHAPRG
jgi:branched-chain amino acid transport system permease protein